MDDKKNEIIDFSNQPLGLMAQEGEKIEKEVNATTNDFNKPIENPNVQDNPFADVNPSQKVEVPVTEPTSQEPVQPASEPAPVASTPEPQPAQLAQEVTVPTPEEQNQQEINKALAGTNKIENTADAGANNSPGSFVVFIIIAVLAAGAIFVFKSGKFDSLLDKEKEEDTKVEEVVKQDESTEEQTEEKKVEEPTQVPVEATQNYKLKETHYLASDKINIYMTYEGIVDIKNKTGDILYTLMVNGVKSKNIHEYTDYANNIGYYEINDGKTKTWYKEKGEYVYQVDEIFNLFKSLNPTDLGNNTYRVDLDSKSVRNFVNDNEYVDLKKANNANVNAEYSVNEGRLVKYKANLNGLIKEYKKYVVVKEFSNYNQNEDVVIPSEIIKTAKEYKS